MKKLLFILLLVSTPAWSATYYTAKDCTGGSAPPNCSDSNTGTTRQTAELTIAAGIAHLSAGDTLVIGDGVYAEHVSGIAAGSAGSPTTIIAEHRGLAIIRPTGGNYGVSINEDYLLFDGIDVDMVNSTSAPFVFTNGGSGVTGLTIQYSIARNGHGDTSSSSGMIGECAASCLLSHNVSHDNTTTTNQDHGIYVSGTGITVEYNTTYSNGAYGLQVYPDCASCIVRGNYSHDNVLRGIVLYTTGIQFYNNVQDTDNWGLEINGNNNLIYSNTFYNNGHGSAGTGQQCIVVTGGSGNLAKNNICYLNQNNAIVQDGGTITESFNVATNPSFTDAPNGVFTLTAGSTAIDAGTVLGSPYNVDITGAVRGSSYDAGAYEFGGVGGTPNYKHIFQSPVIHR